MPVMIILRGIRNLLDEPPAIEYARRRGYVGTVLDVSGETGPQSAQTRAAVSTIIADSEVAAIYGFSGGGYNVRHVLNQLPPATQERIKLVVVLGAPNNPRSLYNWGAWELVYRDDPPAGHMDGPKALLASLGPEPVATGVTGVTGVTGATGATLGPAFRKFLGDLRLKSFARVFGRPKP